jgi:hypothetical protein
MDLPQELKVDVLAEDIAKGQAFSCFRCPIVHAAIRAFGLPPLEEGYKFTGEREVCVLVDTGSIHVFPSDRAFPKSLVRLARYELPFEASQFIHRFDRASAGAAAPFSFVALRREIAP